MKKKISAKWMFFIMVWTIGLAVMIFEPLKTDAEIMFGLIDCIIGIIFCRILIGIIISTCPESVKDDMPDKEVNR